MDILLLAPGLSPEGDLPTRYSAGVARRLHDRCRIRVVAPRDDDPASRDRTFPFEVVRVGGGAAGFAAGAARILRRSVSSDGFDTVLSVSWEGALAAVMGRPREAAVPVHLVVHGPELVQNPMPAPLSGAYDLTLSSVLDHAAGLYPVSRYAARLLASRGVPLDRIHVVEGGVEPHGLSPTDGFHVRRRLGIGSRPMLLSSCPLTAQKGVDLVLKAMPDVLTERPETVLVIAGDGPESGALDSLARHLGIVDAVQFIGAVPQGQLAETLSAADVFVLTPREDPPNIEGFGLAYLEAGACGTPVVGSRTGGIPDAVQDGVTGLLVAPEKPEAIAAAILFFLNDPGAAEQFGAAGRNHVLEWANWDRVADRLLVHLQGAG